MRRLEKRELGIKGWLTIWQKGGQGPWGEGCPNVKTRESGYGIGLHAFLSVEDVVVAAI